MCTSTVSAAGTRQQPHRLAFAARFFPPSIQGGLQSGSVKPQADHLTQHGGRAGVTQGLGEMMPEQLWATTMDPSSRTLKRLTVADAAEASDVFSLLMGHQVPPPPSEVPPGT